VRSLLESLRKVRHAKVLAGLRKVGGALTIKLNHLGAAECNTIRLLFAGTLDTFYELSKVCVRGRRVALLVLGIRWCCTPSLVEHTCAMMDKSILKMRQWHDAPFKLELPQ
jgi:hypothetical protein